MIVVASIGHGRIVVRDRMKLYMLEINSQPINIRGMSKKVMILGTHGPCLLGKLHKYMATHISPKAIKEKTLSLTLVSSNIKD